MDVLGNVRRMLQAGRHTGQAGEPAAEQGEADSGVAPGSHEVPPQGTPGGGVPVPPVHPAESAPVPAPGMGHSGAGAAQPRPAPVLQSPAPSPTYAPPVPRRDDGHVPVPNKEITIRDLKDIRGLANELEEAKKRKPGAK